METIKVYPINFKARTEKEWFDIIVGTAWERGYAKKFDEFQRKNKSGKYYKSNNGHQDIKTNQDTTNF